MTKLPKSLPLVGSSVGPGLDPIRDFEKLKLGNVVLLWLPDSKQEALDVVRYCRDRKIYMMLSEIVKRHNHKRLHCENLSKQDLEEIIAEAGDYFLGRYAIGEAGGMFYWPKSYVINAQAGQYVNMPACRNEAEAHAEYIKYLKGQLDFERTQVCSCPLFNVDSSIAFSYHAEAGIDGQCIEMLPGDPRLTLSAIRGTAKAQNVIWGAHIAMLWYGGIRMDELWVRRWRIALWTAYMFGADFIYPESGHMEYHARGEKWFDFDSEEMLRTRRELRSLYRFTRIHTRPEGGPRVPMAVLQGKDDGHPGIWNPYAWGQYENGEAWESSDAEKGWAMFDTLFQREDIFHENVTGRHNYSGNPPCGQADVIPPFADFSRYRLLILTGYNRMDDALYEKLTDFVKNGGHLILWLSHFDNAEKRGDEVKLFRNGDLSELCGFKVTGREKGDVIGMKFVQNSSYPEYDFPVRTVNRDPYFIGHTEPAEIEITDPAVRVLAAYSDYVRDTLEDCVKHPLMTERRLGKGVVFTVTTFTKPGAYGMRKFAEVLTRTAAKAHRTELELIAPDTVRWAVYPAGKGQVIYLLNSDPDLTQSVRLEYKGHLATEVLLPACAFRTFYVEDEVLFIPQDPVCGFAPGQNGCWNFVLNAGKFEVEDLSGSAKDITVNGIRLHIGKYERVQFDCPANIPAEKAEFMDESYLDEPAMMPSSTATAY